MKYLILEQNSELIHKSSGKGIVNHMHIWRTLDEYELFLIIEGDLYIEQDSQKHHFKKGDFFISDAAEAYGGYEESNCTFHWMHFIIKSGNNHFSEEKKDGNLILPQFGHLNNYDSLVILLVILEQYNILKDREAVRNHLTSAILCDLAQSFIKEENSKNDKDRRFQTIIEYMNTNPYYNEFKNVKTMAEFFGYSEKYLIRLFKKNMNISPMQFFLIKKIMRAEQLLAESDITVKSIASILNYDYYYFMRLFKDKTGMTPMQYRKSIIPDWKNY